MQTLLLDAITDLFKECGIVQSTVAFRIIGDDVKAHHRSLNDGGVLPDLGREHHRSVTVTQIGLHHPVESPSGMEPGDDYPVECKLRIETVPNDIRHIKQLQQPFGRVCVTGDRNH